MPDDLARYTRAWHRKYALLALAVGLSVWTGLFVGLLLVGFRTLTLSAQVIAIFVLGMISYGAAAAGVVFAAGSPVVENRVIGLALLGCGALMFCLTTGFIMLH